MCTCNVKINECYENTNPHILVSGGNKVVDLFYGSVIIEHDGIEYIYCVDANNVVIVDNKRQLVCYTRKMTQDDHYYEKKILWENISEFKKLKHHETNIILLYVVCNNDKIILKVGLSGLCFYTVSGVGLNKIMMDEEILNILLNGIVIYFSDIYISVLMDNKLISVHSFEHKFTIENIEKKELPKIFEGNDVYLSDYRFTIFENKKITYGSLLTNEMTHKLSETCEIEVEKHKIEHINFKSFIDGTNFLTIKTDTSVILYADNSSDNSSYYKKFELAPISLSYDMDNMSIIMRYFEHDKLKTLKVHRFNTKNPGHIEIETNEVITK